MINIHEWDFNVFTLDQLTNGEQLNIILQNNIMLPFNYLLSIEILAAALTPNNGF